MCRLGGRRLWIDTKEDDLVKTQQLGLVWDLCERRQALKPAELWDKMSYDMEQVEKLLSAVSLMEHPGAAGIILTDLSILTREEAEQLLNGMPEKASREGKAPKGQPWTSLGPKNQ